uniref:transposase n=1 Tax=Paenibacillus profundus TaxID=1173085 RepID=UPI003898EEA7
MASVHRLRADTVERFKLHMTAKGATAQQIEEICCDMSPAFIRGIEEYFPDAEITFDKFHVMKLLGEAVDEVRIQEQKHTPELKHTKYIWLKNEVNLKAAQSN